MTTTTTLDTTAQLGEQLKNSGIGLDQLLGTFAPMWETFWPVVKFVLLLGGPGALVGVLGWFFFVRWSQHGVQGL